MKKCHIVFLAFLLLSPKYVKNNPRRVCSMSDRKRNMHEDFRGKLFERLAKINNQFDFLTEVFNAIPEEMENDAVVEYKRWIRSNASTGKRSEISILIHVMFTNKDFYCCIDEWKNIIKLEGENWIGACIYTLKCADNELANWLDKQPIGISVSCPMNSNAEELGSYLVIAPPRSFQHEFLTNHKVNLRRNVQYPNPTGVNAQFEYYSIIRNSHLHGLEPEVKQYKRWKDDIFKKSGLRIACIPFYKDAWVQLVPSDSDPDSDLFDIVSMEKYMKPINDAICNVITELDKDMYNVVIFPEVCMNSNTIEKIQKYVLDDDNILHNIKLIFLGSLWSSNRNEGYLLSSSGKELMRCSKKTAVEPLNAAMHRSTDGRYSRECIHSTPELVFLDVPGIGRISYQICRDILDRNQNVVKSIMMTDFSVISAYTPSTYEFRNVLKEHAQNGMISVLCNACAGARERNLPLSRDVAILSLPKLLRGMRAPEGRICPRQYQSERACEKECDFCACFPFFILSKEERPYTDELDGDTAEYWSLGVMDDWGNG